VVEPFVPRSIAFGLQGLDPLAKAAPELYLAVLAYLTALHYDVDLDLSSDPVLSKVFLEIR
jgi:hypothetical protein